MKKLSLPTHVPSEVVFTEFYDEDLWHVPGYQRNLPHWRLEGATYFITFRLADSLPEAVVKCWQREEESWLHAHDITLGWQRNDPERFYEALARVPRQERRAFEKAQARKFFVALDRCHGGCVLRHSTASKIVEEALLHFHGERVWIGDFVVMPNHVHVIVQPYPGVKVADWMYSVKRFTASQIGKLGEAAGIRGFQPPRRGDHAHFWQIESFDRVVRNRAELAKTRTYIARNPAKLKEGEYVLHLAAWAVGDRDAQER